MTTAANVPTSGVQLIEITVENEGQRIDNFLLTFLKGVPKTRIYRLLRKGEVRVNKGRIQAPYRLVVGDVVRLPPIRVPEEKAQASIGSGLTKTLEGAVLFENDQLLVINKPSGLAVHGGSGITLGLIEALRQMRPDSKFLELVHRLDRDTSGAVMVAKKRSTLTALHDDLRQGRISKIYHALVMGHWSKRLLKIDAPLKKNDLKSGERLVNVDPEGKVSITEFRLLESYEHCSLVEAKPVTGRTHQIRVHVLHAGHPIIGDPKYGDERMNRLMKAEGVKRLFLHAAELRLRLPGSTERLIIKAPMESGLKDALVRLRG
ncbi:MAG: 23S rRNA pseudouridine955/2504/2580 synthase [Motiliproteus sp.]|jgi:23S rRNA pseudouridine955/2504/2580 synthase